MDNSRESFFLWDYLKSKLYVRKPRTVAGKLFELIEIFNKIIIVA